MSFKHYIIIGLLFCICWTTNAQQAYPVISFDYKETTLENVLNDLERRYNLYFSYSSSLLPMNFGVTATTDDELLPAALQTLFESVPIRHAIIGGQIALRADPGKELKQLDTSIGAVRQTSPIHQEPRPTPPSVAPIQVRKTKQVTGGDGWISEDLNSEVLSSIVHVMEEHERSLEVKEYNETHRLAQISLLPYLGTNTHRSHEIVNNYSFNILWGTSKGIDGFEFGGIANSVTESVSGVQIAGAINIVGENVTGTQIAGMFNQVGGKMSGAQLALGGNMVQDSVSGEQYGGLFNHCRGDVDGNQIAGIFNYAKGDVRHQYGLVYNEADDVTHRQIGFINVCDTSYKAPIGFLSIVRRGYNRFELGSGEGLFAQMSGKFGTRKFYNIFFLGARWDNIESINSNGTFISWGLGYGFGTAPRLGKKILLNTEVIGMHINELEVWTDELNFLTQVRLTFDWKAGRHLSFYAGPVLNIMWSERYNADTQTVGSRLAPEKPLWNHQNGSTNWKGWIGFTAGMRI